MELNENFSYSGTKQNFDRDSYATLAEMKAVKAKKMPSIFHATCAETGKLYIYNKTNTDDEILGKWREVSGSSTNTESVPSVKEEYSIPAGYIIDFDEDDNAEAVYKKLELIYESSNSQEPSVKLQGPNSYEFVNFNRSQGVYSTGFDEHGNEVDFGYTRYTLTFKSANNNDITCTLSALYTDDGKRYEGLVRDNCTWFTAYVRDVNFGGVENFFNNNGPSLPIYSFTQGGKTSDDMFGLIGDSYYAYYHGDFGRGNEPFIVGETTSRAESCTVYIENAPAFGTQKCKLFAINTVGEVYEGFFVTTRTEPTFTSDGLVWRKVESKSADSPSDYLRIEDDSNVVYLVSSNNKSEVSPDDIFNYTNLPFYILKSGFNSDVELKYVGDVGSDGHSGVVFASEPFLEDDYSKSASLRKLLMYTAELVTYRHAWYMINPEIKEIGSGSCECEEDTDTIDFSTWPEYTSPEANGIVLDGQGGANIDDSNISVDPEDIEEED